MNESMVNSAALTAGRVAVLLEDGTVAVLVEGTDERLVCDMLYAGDTPPVLGVGDQVLIWRGTAERGVLVGRVGPTNRPGPEKDTPDTLALEAKSNLILKCGDGSITIRADGKIMIKGKNLVSLALETNRIKGGSVSIN
jgi:hypothetical protein